MAKRYPKRKFPNLIIVEGLWNIGKSTTIRRLRQASDFLVIEEPDHLACGIERRIEGWYREEHVKRMRMALALIKKGKKIIMERSLISSISYQYAVRGSLSVKDMATLKKIGTMLNSDACVIFLYSEERFAIARSKRIRDEGVKKYYSTLFYKRYIKFYKSILPKYVTHVKLMKVGESTSVTQRKTIDVFLKIFPLLGKEKAESASVVAFYRGKILMLYDHDYKHLVLPQGHRKRYETLRQTALREMAEETGLNHAKIIKKLEKYQYHYPAEDKVVYKTIHVYLTQILSMRKVGKKLEPHENYSNRFYSPFMAVRKAKWIQDKKVIQKASAYINDPRLLK
jgi:8-oxo-dGTP pyrophosphatase MutT (NUDIX family)/thymidylate kinase